MSNFLQSMMQKLAEPSNSVVVFPVLLSFLIILFSVIFLKKWVLINNPSRTTKNLPPSPPKLPFVGNLHQLGLVPNRSLQSLSRKHGPLMFLQFGRIPTLVVSSADAAKEIFKIHDLDVSNRPNLRVLKRLLYDYKDVSMAPYGELWRQLKSIYVLQLLSNKRVQSFRGMREEEIALMVQRIWELGSVSLPVNLTDTFIELTNGVICRVVLGKKYEGELGEEFNTLLRDFITLTGILDIGNFVPWLGWVNWISGVDAKIDRVAKGLDEFLKGLVEERLKSNSDGDDSEGNKNFFDVLLQIYKNSAGISIDRDCIKAQILIAFAAGTDTTNAWAIGRDPSTWDEPDEFRPEGFLNSPVDFRGHDFQLIPFGAGRRGCPGISFATVIGELLGIVDLMKHELLLKLLGRRGETFIPYAPENLV